EYIFRHYQVYWTKVEHLAYQHALGMDKYDQGDDQLKQKRFNWYKEHYFTENQDALNLLKDGFDNFKTNLSIRIWNTYGESLEINRCPKCNGVARTPKARQCRFCFAEWR